jgi:hypothetical protein
MNHFEFPTRFRRLYENAVDAFGRGQREPGRLFSDEESAWLAANGITAQHLYDYAEDHHKYGGEPGAEHALAIELVRRDYFLNVQGGRPSAQRLDEASLPAKTDTVHGIAWLPRLIPKALAKLRGELPDSLMFGCSGDRKFFKQHNVLPAEFLSLLWRHEHDLDAVVGFVARRSAAAAPTEASARA